MVGQEIVYKKLEELGIVFDYLEHPAAPTAELGKQYCVSLPGKHCKNLFFRNHKGNRHYLVIFDCDKELAIRDLEQILKQGKLSFASEQRMVKYLGLYPGSVSPFGLLNDTENHVYVFLDKNLKLTDKISFHPNDNHASLSIDTVDFIRYMDSVGNAYEWIELY
ncbi:prolyl-tRNA synthetase associated domain-containing protein [Odoribacter sp. OttesenSCG-928-J03]|nr:prolyl-tRNA synthetase associated domain-containing protein [Odoribacter sp. OttesenSCG-928-J03]MDL2282916.1 prolyl-tRNA synthetase associated domain-containing protein [Odoribacter sp. OttesenSCG-928-G04]MDL2330882.1 prolyl-tRNA synthetase associated domain-containing protein [Odoribacter sp. OttesenSCG-928-A06]